MDSRTVYQLSDSSYTTTYNIHTQRHHEAPTLLLFLIFNIPSDPDAPASTSDFAVSPY